MTGLRLLFYLFFWMFSHCLSIIFFHGKDSWESESNDSFLNLFELILADYLVLSNGLSHSM